jgi:tetratricopeptide (TPR) repeat protein
VIASGHHSASPAAAYGLAELLNQLGKVDAAREAYQTAIDADDPVDSPAAAFGLGTMLAAQVPGHSRDEAGRRDAQRDLQAASAAFQVAIASRHPDYALLAAHRLAEMLEEQGDHDGARSALRAVIDLGDADQASWAVRKDEELLAEQIDLGFATTTPGATAGSGSWVLHVDSEARGNVGDYGEFVQGAHLESAIGLQLLELSRTASLSENNARQIQGSTYEFAGTVVHIDPQAFVINIGILAYCNVSTLVYWEENRRRRHRFWSRAGRPERIGTVNMGDTLRGVAQLQFETDIDSFQGDRDAYPEYGWQINRIWEPVQHPARQDRTPPPEEMSPRETLYQQIPQSAGSGPSYYLLECSMVTEPTRSRA